MRHGAGSTMIGNIVRNLVSPIIDSVIPTSGELVRNGDFSQPLSTDDWIPSSGTVQSIVDGRLKIENGTGGYKRSSQGITVDTGATYRLVVDAIDDSQSGNAAEAKVYIGLSAGTRANSNTQSLTLSTPQTPIWDYTFVPSVDVGTTGDTDVIYIVLICHVNAVGAWTTYDNVSLKKVS